VCAGCQQVSESLLQDIGRRNQAQGVSPTGRLRDDCRTATLPLHGVSPAHGSAKFTLLLLLLLGAGLDTGPMMSILQHCGQLL
jgi:hypothetical protein